MKFDKLTLDFLKGPSSQQELPKRYIWCNSFKYEHKDCDDDFPRNFVFCKDKK